jgi:hypothetical protein
MPPSVIVSRSNSDLERYQSMQTQLLAGLNESVLRLQESRELLLEG